MPQEGSQSSKPQLGASPPSQPELEESPPAQPQLEESPPFQPELEQSPPSQPKPGLLSLPSELIEQLSEHLDWRSVVRLSAACQRLRQLLGPPAAFWHVRVRRLLVACGGADGESNCYRRHRLLEELLPLSRDATDDPDIPEDACRRRCASMETAVEQFASRKGARHRRMQYGIGVCIDALQLLPAGCELAAVGSRDQTFGLVSLRGIRGGAPDADCFAYIDRQHHGGWIWSVAAQDDSVLTGCWDRVLRRFALHPAQLADAVMLGSPVLCTAWMDRALAVAGCFDRSAYLLDCRNIRNISSKVTVHSSRPVLCVARLSDRYLLTAGEDTNVCVTDLRGSLSQPVQRFSLGRSRYLRCLAKPDPLGRVWGAVQHGGLKCFNWCQRECRLTEVTPAEDGDRSAEPAVTGLDSSGDALLVCREKHPMQAYLATLPPRPLAQWPGAVSVSCRDGFLATGSLDGDLQFWWRD